MKKWRCHVIIPRCWCSLRMELIPLFSIVYLNWLPHISVVNDNIVLFRDLEWINLFNLRVLLIQIIRGRLLLQIPLTVKHFIVQIFEVLLLAGAQIYILVATHIIREVPHRVRALVGHMLFSLNLSGRHIGRIRSVQLLILIPALQYLNLLVVVCKTLTDRDLLDATVEVIKEHGLILYLSLQFDGSSSFGLQCFGGQIYLAQ